MPLPPSNSSPSPPYQLSPPHSSSVAFPTPPPPQLKSSESSPPPALLSKLSPPPSSVSTGTTRVVAGIVIGGVAILAVLALLWMMSARKRKRIDRHGAESYYMTSRAPEAGHFPPADTNGNPKPFIPPATSFPASHSSQHSTPRNPHSFSNSGGFLSNNSGSSNPMQPSSPVLGLSTSAYTYEELAAATDGFSDTNLLGQGGFGYVHKGIFPNGKLIAVKSLKADSGQGEREFQAEVEIISRVHHKHLVSLVGYCIAGSQKLLVYDFVPNRTLEFHLHGKGRPSMDWPTRLKVAVGAAKGLAYLHEDCHPKIIHRDIKAANILLDSNFEAKVADFGLAKSTPDVGGTHVSTRVMGTFGYLAPEYASSGKLTEKSDIFSFGVLLLELITGQPPVNYSKQAYMEDSLVDWARPLLSRAVEDGNFESLVDPRLENNYNPDEMGRMVFSAGPCIRHSAKRRPRMSQVVRALEGNLALSVLNDGIQPGHSASLSYAISESENSDLQGFRKMVFSSQDFEATNEYGGATN